MTISKSWKRHFFWGTLLYLCGLAAVAAQGPSPGQSAGPQDIPGPLSAAHVPKPGEADCMACHISKGKIAPAKCLGCHEEIASRITAGKGYHRDKGDDCADCHAEHQGRQANIVPLERESFDHAETGAVLQGAHLKPKDCDKCHTLSNTLPRITGRSYLLKDSGCRGCHRSPHPGRQDSCLACHNEERWRVEGKRTRE